MKTNRTKYVYKNSDLTLKLHVTDMNGIPVQVEDLEYFTASVYTTGGTVFTASYAGGEFVNMDENFRVFIPSNVVTNFADGNLKLKIEYGLADSNFPDMVKDIMSRISTNIFLRDI